MLKLLVKCENYINQCKDIDNYLSYIMTQIIKTRSLA